MRNVEQLIFKIAAELSSGVSSLLAPTGFRVSSCKLSYRLFQNQFHCHSSAEPSVAAAVLSLGGRGGGRGCARHKPPRTGLEKRTHSSHGLCWGGACEGILLLM